MLWWGAGYGMERREGSTMLKTGGCNCKTIRYQVTGKPLFVHVCHCRECQRDSGGAFNMTMLLLATDFQITHGIPAEKRVTRLSGKQYFGYFCEQCGNPIYGAPVDPIGLIVLRPGTLDEIDQLQPQAHIWVQEKQPWVQIPKNVPSFAKEYNLYELWPAESLTRMQSMSN